MTKEFWERLRGKYRRCMAASLCRRPAKMQNTAPIISFSFDDFPQSALTVGGKILNAYGVAGTYYVSLGLLNRDDVVGRICSERDLEEALVQRHELGCHTFSHCDPWETEASTFKKSILDNRQALEGTFPGARFQTMAYPINGTPPPATKRWAGGQFACCRAGGQRINLGTVDLNYVRAFFLEQSRDTPSTIWEMIDQNRIERGWLVFATHDVANYPSRFGCTPALFEEVVRRSVESGAMVLPIAKALTEVCGQQQRASY